MSITRFLSDVSVMASNKKSEMKQLLMMMGVPLTFTGLCVLSSKRDTTFLTDSKIASRKFTFSSWCLTNKKSFFTISNFNVIDSENKFDLPLVIRSHFFTLYFLFYYDINSVYISCSTVSISILSWELFF